MGKRLQKLYQANKSSLKDECLKIHALVRNLSTVYWSLPALKLNRGAGSDVSY